jgi:SAM-dependent methyltransferase
MSVFDLYSAYYDLLYRDKDYPGESRYLCQLLEAYARRPVHTLFELGCGTGGHGVELARAGHAVHGIDVSERMVERAQRRVAEALEVSSRLRFNVGDVRSHRAGRRYDAVVSLFHVMSYQTTQSDLASTCATAREHLDVDGVFVFDCWYGPAVLTDRPRHENKRVADDRITVQRRTTPTMRVNDNCVDVRFDVDVTALASGERQTLCEVHRMRYLFLPEIEALLGTAGFGMAAAHRWMTREPLDDQSWYACIVAHAV